MTRDKTAPAIAAVLTLPDEVRAHAEHGDLAGLSVSFTATPWAYGAAGLARTLLMDVAGCPAVEGDPEGRSAPDVRSVSEAVGMKR
jgi:hypothetical protein